ncbi:MAG: ParB/RepB/Spo0J family partition protein [Sulfitobacter sp.]|uniref:ParB/RepB/Spo0J family partition protein n=1 Tax=Sulfitobacter sp. TaxID=1903071 RepID=UPI004058363B
MARRKRLEAPTEEALRDLEEGFARETKTAGGALVPMPPIAKVAAEAAQAAPMQSAQDRARAAQDAAEAERYRAALAAGLLVQDIPLSQIAADATVRDRLSEDSEAMDELKASLETSGQRLPIELYPLEASENGVPKFALISGFRRLSALRLLFGETGDERYATAKAIVRDVPDPGQAYLAMVEENEIRSDLSHYERGCIAVMAAGQGAYASTEEAVDALLATGSKAKRSKIRSFAELHEVLGDLLAFPTHLSERQGLRLSGAVRNGFAREIRAAMATGMGTDPAAKWAQLEPVIETAEAALGTRKDGAPGRPRKSPAPTKSDAGPGYYKLESGITLIRDRDSKGYYIRIKGKQVNCEMIDVVMEEIKRLLEPH